MTTQPTCLRLVYASRANFSAGTDNATVNADVARILMQSRRNNPAKNITGVLVHGGGLFMQVLEGPEKEVLRQYVKILDDPRNSDARIIQVSPANNRLFDKWSMGGIASDPMDFQHISEFRDRRLEVVQATMFADTMRGFVQRLKAAK